MDELELSHRMKKPLLLLSLSLLLTLFRCGGNPHQGNPNSDFDFNLPDLNGKTHSMKDFRGQILVLNLWATWCPPCSLEVPKLNDLFDRYKGRGVRGVGIALDKDSLDLVSPFVEAKKITYPILVGSQEVISGFRKFEGVPTTILFDQKGKAVKRFDGTFDSEQLEESLQSLLED
jgi:peroxiredoxin